MNLAMREFCKVIKQTAHKLFKSEGKMEAQKENPEEQLLNLLEDRAEKQCNQIMNTLAKPLFAKPKNQYRKNSGIWWLMEQDEDKIWKIYLDDVDLMYKFNADLEASKILSTISAFDGCSPITPEVFKKYRSLKSRAGSKYKWTLCNRDKPTKEEHRVSLSEKEVADLLTVDAKKPVPNKNISKDISFKITTPPPYLALTCPHCNNMMMIKLSCSLPKHPLNETEAKESNNNFVHNKISFGDE